MRNAYKMMMLDMHAVSARNNVVYIYLAIDLITIGLAYSPMREDAFLIGFGGMIGGSGAYLITPFISSAQRSLDALYAMLPIRRRDVVHGHYLFALTVGLLMLANTWLTLMVIHLLRPALFGSDFQILLSVSLVGPYMLLMMTAVQYPILMRVSYEKAPYAVFLPFIVTGLFVGYLGGISSQFVDSRLSFSSGPADRRDCLSRWCGAVCWVALAGPAIVRVSGFVME